MFSIQRSSEWQKVKLLLFVRLLQLVNILGTIHLTPFFRSYLYDYDR